MITRSLSAKPPGIPKPCLPFQTRWLLFVSSSGLLLFVVGRLLKLMLSKFHARFSRVWWIRSPSLHDQHDIWIKSSCIEPEQLRKALEDEYRQRDDVEPELKDFMIEYRLSEYLERERKAWGDAIRILNQSPERIVKELCELLDYFLEAKSNKAELLLYYICKYTTSQPDLVPFDWLERWIGSAGQLEE